MSFDNYAIYDKMILGKPRPIGDLTFIPLIHITVRAYYIFSLFLGMSISPEAFIIREASGMISFYNISDDATFAELLANIMSTVDEE
ncbi:MAG: hypothetical protein GXW90_07175 [Tepidanaerobacter acetatoxydans]|jgi:hypothetical protein|uniref:hypothetical protein n=1 Tax=Tepidanaerobacter TaxID=499228 RepID=UPI000A581E13|nr:MULTISPECIES: hypothetical protein [Tepidanaerobacter]NLU10699.1 hypothetical protein [Tepidanaerobacter acetatoxydans]